ncbi:MAG: glycoside hydrolase family 99-like domain-containing protein [Bacteroidales bacterium]|nr:glycoside hydrolase family 99-like domain-containing protein [Bacteroidales bacterium]
MARLIAFYLPQYHPIPENDEWWGKGFTEWTNVAKARPLFLGHHQPNIPADLGFYDLRLPEVREAQAALAKEAGIEGFCYWHYWFGGDKRICEKPFNEVLNSGKPDFPFCLAWANHSWYKKLWDPDSPGKDILLIEQKYLGVEDYSKHFYEMLPAFNDPRYLKVNNKLLFVIFDHRPKEIPLFIKTWRELASKNGLSDFYFISKDASSRAKETCFIEGFDAVVNDDKFNIHHNLSFLKKGIFYVCRNYLHLPTRFSYKEAIKYMVIDDCENKGVIPSIAPNWDHSPRSGKKSIILTRSTPQLFKSIAKRAIKIVSRKPKDEQIIFIASWNEWGEGNYMEPDLQFGKGYINALREAIIESKNE